MGTICYSVNGFYIIHEGIGYNMRINIKHLGVVLEALERCIKVDHTTGQEEVTFSYHHLHPQYDFVLEEEEEDEEEEEEMPSKQSKNECVIL